MSSQLAQPSVVMTARQRDAIEVASMLEVNAERIGKKLDKRMDGLAQEGEPVVQWSSVVLNLARKIRQETSAADEADLAHSVELGEDQGAREARDQTYTTAYNQGVWFRGNILSLYGEAFLAQIGLDHETPREPWDLVRHLEDARAHVMKRVQWPQALVPSFPAWKQDALAQALLDASMPLRKALEDLKREERETKVTMTVKWDTMAKQREVLMAVIMAGAGLFRLAGERELAERIHPTGGRKAAQDKEPEAPVNETPPEGQETPPEDQETPPEGIVTP